MMVVDASVWISMLMVGDPYHDESRVWLERQVLNDQALLATEVLAIEIAGATARITGQPADGHFAAARLRATAGVRLFSLDRERGARATQVAADLRLRGADATYVALAIELGVPLVSWDREQLERAAHLVVTYSPANDPGRSPH